MRQILKLVPNDNLEEFEKSMKLHLSELIYGSVTKNHGRFVTQFKFIVGDDELEELENFYEDYCIEYFREEKEVVKVANVILETVEICIDSIESLFNAVDFATVPYLESDEYGEGHWSYELNQAKQDFIDGNDLIVEDTMSTILMRNRFNKL